MNAQPEPDEFCPRCGHWVTQTRVDTGWCEPCSVEEDRFGQVCIRCHRPRPKTHYAKARSHRGKVCRSCRTAVRRRWREAHPEQEAASTAARRARYGYARCPACHLAKPLNSKGILCQHQPTTFGWVSGASPCPGGGFVPDSRPDLQGHSTL